MKNLFETRLFNRYVYITAFFLVVSLFLSWIFVSGLVEILFLDYGAYDLPQRAASENRAEMLPIFLQQIMIWEMLVDSSMAYIIHFLPLFFIFPTIPFFYEKKSYFVFGRHRFKSLSKSLWRGIVQHSLVAAFINSATFITFYAITGIFVTRESAWMTMYGSFLPQSFYQNYPFLFVVFMFLTIYFALAFVFAFISCSVLLWVDNPFYGIFGIVIAYYIYLNVGSYLDYILNLRFDLFWLGDTVASFNTWRTTSEVFIPLIPLFLIGIVIAYFGVKKEERNVTI